MLYEIHDLQVKGHKNPRVLQANERRLNDDQWHDIVVEKHGKSLKIIVRLSSLISFKVHEFPSNLAVSLF